MTNSSAVSRQIDELEESHQANTNSPLSTVERFISAGIGSTLTSLLVTPLDVVKVRMQSKSDPLPKLATTISHVQHRPHFTPHFRYQLHAAGPSGAVATSECIVNCCSEVFFSNRAREQFKYSMNSLPKGPGIREAMISIARAEGLLSLWRGLAPTLIMQIPANVIYFVGYDSLKLLLIPCFGGYTPLVAGGASRAIAATVISPLELIRTQMQGYKGTRPVHDIMRNISLQVQRHGPTYLWRALVPTLFRDVPFSALYWANYELLKEWYTRPLRYSPNGMADSIARNANVPTSFPVAFLAGASSGIIAATLTTPFDVIKTRRQLAHQPYYKAAGSSDPLPSTRSIRPRGRRASASIPSTHIKTEHPTSLKNMVIDIFRHEGVRGLFCGLIPRVVKVAPACAIMIGSYEYGKRFFGHFHAST